jgi:hypothetical protein
VALPSDGDLRSLPKVELHVHVEGSITAATALALTRRYRADRLERIDTWPLMAGRPSQASPRGLQLTLRAHRVAAHPAELSRARPADDPRWKRRSVDRRPLADAAWTREVRDLVRAIDRFAIPSCIVAAGMASGSRAPATTCAMPASTRSHHALMVSR